MPRRGLDKLVLHFQIRIYDIILFFIRNQTYFFAERMIEKANSIFF